MCFRYAKISGPKGMKGFVLASDVWVSGPKMTQIDVLLCLLSDNQTSGRIRRHACPRKIFSQLIAGVKIHVL